LQKWFVDNWFEIVQTIGIIAGLVYTAHALNTAKKSQKVSNLFLITQYHREIWKTLLENPNLSRVLEPNLTNITISQEENIFVTFLILHLSAAFQAIKIEAITPIEGLALDIQTFFSLPIPRKVWEDQKKYQNQDFVKFVNEALAKKE